MPGFFKENYRCSQLKINIKIGTESKEDTICKLAGLALRDGLIYVLDFKPEARKENRQKVASQLYFYSSGFSFRARIPLDRFRPSWFDDSVYYEFAPKEAKILEKGVQVLYPNRVQDPGKDNRLFGKD